VGCLKPESLDLIVARSGGAGPVPAARQISFTQFKAFAQHNSSLIRCAVTLRFSTSSTTSW
jgi:hypothetical protein